MQFKLIVAFVNDTITNDIIASARIAGAKGATIINNARGEGRNQHKTFLGLSLETQRDVVLFVVESSLCEAVIEAINHVGEFESKSGAGIVLQIDIEKALGVMQQFDINTSDDTP